MTSKNVAIEDLSKLHKHATFDLDQTISTYVRCLLLSLVLCWKGVLQYRVSSLLQATAYGSKMI